MEPKKYGLIPGFAPGTLKLIEMLKDGRPGDSFTDERLTRQCGQSTATNGKGYAHLNSAIRYVERNHNVIWRRERGTGTIKCLDGAETLDTVQADRRGAARRIRRACARTEAIAHDELPKDRMAEHSALSAQLRGLKMFADAAFTKTLEKRRIDAPPTTERLLEAFLQK